MSLLNIITELKKTCNHPFLFESAEESYRGRDDENAVDRLVLTSGKVTSPPRLSHPPPVPPQCCCLPSRPVSPPWQCAYLLT